ncbi:MAG: tetratricopeptide repeat protein, partial [Planctomycetes bacterium]|nr:tetratricopeptide repeat protein [Planctomycetota bacterium]
DLELANTENSRARALSKKKDLDGARQALTRARELLEKRVDEPDTPPAWYGDLGRTCGNLGLILYLQNQREKARDHFQQAIRHLENAREKNPANPEYLEPLRENYRNLAESFLQLGEPRRAAQAAESLAGISKGLPLETYFAACFMARSAATDNDDHAHRVALALRFLEEAVLAGFDDFGLLQKNRKPYFTALEGEKAFHLRYEEVREKARPSLGSPTPKR